MAVTEDGNIAVAEYLYNTVTLYSTTGQYIHSFGTANCWGKGDGEFICPCSVDIRGDLLYVLDKVNNRVQKFSISRQCFISKFGSSGQGNLSEPNCICADPEGMVYVADYGKNLILMEMTALPTPSLASQRPGEWLLIIRGVFTLLLLWPTVSESSHHRENNLPATEQRL